MTFFIERPNDGSPLRKEEFRFTVIRDLQIRLTGYSVLERKTMRHKFLVLQSWDWYRSMHSKNSIDCPTITPDVLVHKHIYINHFWLLFVAFDSKVFSKPIFRIVSSTMKIVVARKSNKAVLNLPSANDIPLSRRGHLPPKGAVFRSIRDYRRKPKHVPSWD